MPSVESAAGLQAELLATGKIRSGLSIAAAGPTEITYRRVSIQPSGFTGWHYHPGPVAVIVESGVLTRMFSDGSSEVSGPGDIIIEPAGPEHVHAGHNQGNVPVVLYMAYFIPCGAEHTVAAEAPRGCRPTGRTAQAGLETAA
ncbi:cupin domain-containing protein [Streptomyces sp. NPDC001401]|uniref:cupin domain-containing protein n=1 Tax=Streptomyces sp. NPDC001401 TaxID=3364570 RepID=UPI0036843B59